MSKMHRSLRDSSAGALAPRAVRLTISDNGAGFTTEALRQPGCAPDHGLIAMRERAEFIGGTFEIASQPGRGTRISISVALTASDPDAFSGSSAAASNQTHSINTQQDHEGVSYVPVYS